MFVGLPALTFIVYVRISPDSMVPFYKIRSLISFKMLRQVGNISVAVLAQFAFGAFSSVPTFLHAFSNSFDFTRMGA